MKKSILTIATIGMISGLVLTSCDTPAQKVENAKEDVLQSKEKLAEAKREYQEDMASYKKETMRKIEANNLTIKELDKKATNDKKVADEQYKKQVAELKAKNLEMGERMEKYKDTNKQNWENFKIAFNREMNELDRSFDRIKGTN